MNNYEFSPVRHFWHKKIGYNFRLSSIQAAIGLGQMEHIEDTLKRKLRIARWYEKHLKPVRDRVIPYALNPNGTGNFWHMAYRIPERGADIMGLRNFLGQNGVETRSAFLPLHLQPAYRKKAYEGQFPRAEQLSQTSILFPSGPTLTEVNVGHICRLVINFLKRGYGKKRIPKNL
jgi:perosamine synthetase